MKKIFLPITILLLFALVACGGNIDTEGLVESASNIAEDVVEAVDEGLSETIDWGYDGAGAPENWAGLKDEYAPCGNGQNQSPIDLTGAEPTGLKNIVFNYADTAVKIFNNGHTIESEYDEENNFGGNSIQIQIGDKTKTYNLWQFHFHTPSEHEIDGQPMDGEMHLVHKDKDNKNNVAVVGVMIKIGAENPNFAPVWEQLPANKDDTIEGVSINAASLLPDTQTYYNYTGSLTTPPCTEGVQWFVLTTPIEMSETQVNDLHNIIHNNNRPVQELGERTIKEDITDN
jgi:carbonic anhydrase